MSTKKRQTYNSMAKVIAEMQAKMDKERQRMAGVMADALLDGDGAAKLGDYNDTDLRRIMSMLAGYIDPCIKKLESEKQAKAARAEAPQPGQAQPPQTAPVQQHVQPQQGQYGGYQQGQ